MKEGDHVQKKANKIKLNKPNSIIFDVYGVLTSHHFKLKLKQYVRDHLKSFFVQNWTRKRVRTLLRKLTKDYEQLVKTNEQLPCIHFDEKWWPPASSINPYAAKLEQLKQETNNETSSLSSNSSQASQTSQVKETNENSSPKASTLSDSPDSPNCLTSEQIDLIVAEVEKHVLFRMDHRMHGDSLLLLWNEIWESGFKDGSLKAHVYDEVAPVLESWRMQLFIKLYTLASGQSAGQKLFFKNTIAGDLTSFLANYMDPSSIGKTNEKCFNAIVYALRDKPSNLLYFTDSLSKLKTAMQAGLRSVLVVRTDNEIEGAEDEEEGLLKVTSLQDVEFVNPTECKPMQECC